MGISPSVPSPAYNRVTFSRPMESSDEALFGKILLLGGTGDASVDCRHPALGVFVSLAGGRRARILILAQTSNDERSESNAFAAALRSLGAKRVDVVELPATPTGHLSLGAAVPNATGFLFVGDDPGSMLASLAGSVLLSTIRSRYENGATIAGMRAGAAILGREVFAAPFDVPAGVSVPVGRKHNRALYPGLKFLPGWVVDPSYGLNRNLDNLLMSLAANPALMGLGIEKGSSVLANSTGQVTSLGGGLAVVVDGRDAISDYAERRLGEMVSIAGPRLYLLGEGKRFDPRVGVVPSLLGSD